MMGDNHTSKVIGSGNVEIQFTSGKKLTLMNVLHVPNIRKNLVSGFKLCKSGVKAVIESDKVILSKANVFVGKAYACDGMFKLNINKITSSAYLPDCNFISSFNIECSTFNLWHNHLDSNVIVESRDVNFFENKFRHDSTSTNEIVTQISQDISSPDLNSFNKRNMAESSSAPRRSERARKERNLDPDFIDSQAIIFLVEGDNENNVKEAIDDEMDSIVSNNTWELSDLPPVPRITSIRVLFELASIYNLPIHQMDVKTAILNEDLDEEVFMKQPEGFVLPGHKNKICKLKKSLYELKQAPKQWHDKFDKSRPDIAYAVCKLSRYMSNPRYSNASWITGISDSKSTTGWIFTLVAHKEAKWLRNLLLDIELWPQLMPAISLHYDSQSTLSRAYNKVYNGKSRHISLRHAHIKELISNGIITIEYIRSCKNLADPFTKGLPKDIVFGTTREMGLKPIELTLDIVETKLKSSIGVTDEVQEGECNCCAMHETELMLVLHLLSSASVNGESFSHTEVEHLEGEDDFEIAKVRDHAGFYVVNKDGTRTWYPDILPHGEKPIQGTQFVSIDQAYSFYVAYGKKTGFDVRRGGEYKAVGFGDVTTKYFHCIREGFLPNPKEKSGVKSLDVDISEHSEVSDGFERIGNVFEVTSLIEGHNHPLVVEKDMIFMKNLRNVSYTKQHFLYQVSNTNFGPAIGFRLMKQIHWGFDMVGIRVNDCKNQKKISVFIGDRDAQMAVEKFLS
ncbi:zinc finger, CCHC-type containing protein [Tanacetum coccineum]